LLSLVSEPVEPVGEPVEPVGEPVEPCRSIFIERKSSCISMPTIKEKARKLLGLFATGISLSIAK
jgi:hypothetical protein